MRVADTRYGGAGSDPRPLFQFNREDEMQRKPLTKLKLKELAQFLCRAWRENDRWPKGDNQFAKIFANCITASGDPDFTEEEAGVVFNFIQEFRSPKPKPKHPIMKKILNKGDKELLIHHVLKGVVDRLESCEPGESNYDFRRGCISVAASVVQQVTNYHGSDVFIDDVFEAVNKFVNGLDSETHLSEQAFEVMFAEVMTKFVNPK